MMAKLKDIPPGKPFISNNQLIIRIYDPNNELLNIFTVYYISEGIKLTFKGEEASMPIDKEGVDNERTLG